MDALKKMHNKAVVKLDKTMGLVVFLLNIFCSGAGTLVAGILKGGDDILMNAVIVFCIQWFLCWLIVPWIWSIMLGYQIFKASGN